MSGGAGGVGEEDELDVVGARGEALCADAVAFVGLQEDRRLAAGVVGFQHGAQGDEAVRAVAGEQEACGQRGDEAGVGFGGILTVVVGAAAGGAPVAADGGLVASAGDGGGEWRRVPERKRVQDVIVRGVGVLVVGRVKVGDIEGLGVRFQLARFQLPVSGVEACGVVGSVIVVEDGGFEVEVGLDAVERSAGRASPAVVEAFEDAGGVGEPRALIEQRSEECGGLERGEVSGGLPAGDAVADGVEAEAILAHIEEALAGGVGVVVVGRAEVVGDPAGFRREGVELG